MDLDPSFVDPWPHYNRELPAPDTSCYTQFIGTSTFKNESSPFSAELIYDSMRRRMLSLHFHGKTILDSVMINWSEPDSGFDYTYTIASNKWTINYATAFRVGLDWYLRISLTNMGHNLNLPLFTRQLLSEYLRSSSNHSRLQALQFTERKRPNGNGTHFIFLNFTTTLSSISGSQVPYVFQPEYPEENIALIVAFYKSDRSFWQVYDALEPSSLALFPFPLTLNLIPIALWQTWSHSPCCCTFCWTTWLPSSRL